MARLVLREELRRLGGRVATAVYSTKSSSPNSDGTCGHEVVFWGSDQMDMRRETTRSTIDIQVTRAWTPCDANRNTATVAATHD